jgi:hypothetical protein
LLVIVLITSVALASLAYARRWIPQQSQGAAERAPAEPQKPVAAYADTASCAVCHDEIARTRADGQRSLSRVRPGSALADFNSRNRVYHKASDRHYTMVERDGRFYQRRHQIGFDGREANTVEFEAHYVMGSGNHARTFLHRSPDGRLLQLPLSWYAERGGYWAMSPGYDRPAHLDFRRLINEDCMSCHNAYPRAGVADEGNGPSFAEPLSEGIDCQRCHGPGQPHVDAVKTGDLDKARRAIANPATFDRERRPKRACNATRADEPSAALPDSALPQPPLVHAHKPLGDYVIFRSCTGQRSRRQVEIAGAPIACGSRRAFSRAP